MQIVGREEHVAVPELLAAWSRIPGLPQIPELGFGGAPLAQRRRDAGHRRLAEMDDQGVDVQVLSLSMPGTVPGVRGRPDPGPAAAAAELERAVTQLGFRGALLYGRTGTAPADAPPFDALYAAAARLGARARLIMPLRAHCAPGKRAG